jgi:hypothetical protein
MFHKRSSVINSIYYGQLLFSYKTLFFYKASYLNEESTVLNLPLQLVFPERVMLVSPALHKICTSTQVTDTHTKTHK